MVLLVAFVWSIISRLRLCFSQGFEEGDWLKSKILSPHLLNHYDIMELLTETDCTWARSLRILEFNK